MWPWIAVARLFSNCRLAAFSTAFDLTALRRLAVLDSAVAADAFWFRVVPRDDAFLLMFNSAPLLMRVWELLRSSVSRLWPYQQQWTSPSCPGRSWQRWSPPVREARGYAAAVYRAPTGLRAGGMSGHHFDMRSLMTTEGGRRLVIVKIADFTFAVITGVVDVLAAPLFRGPAPRWRRRSAT